MANRVIIPSYDGQNEAQQDVLQPRKPLSGAQRQARYHARKEAASARMKRIAEKAELFNSALKRADVEQLSLPLSLVADDVEQTLTNLTEWLSMPEQLREQAQNKRKRR
jgi:hypothetical protein